MPSWKGRPWKATGSTARRSTPRVSGERPSAAWKYATLETLTLSPLPCWKDLSLETQRNLAAALVAEIEADAAAKRERTGRPVLCVVAIRAQDPQGHPNRPKKSPAPLFHAATKAIRKELYEGYAWFVAAYREAAEKLREGNRTAVFPTGSFPPPMPFVAA